MTETTAPHGLWARIRPELGRMVRTARSVADRVLHPFKRYAAVTRIRRIGVPSDLVVLCYGNICRSPYAAVKLTRAFEISGASTVVRQGGFFGPDRPSTDMARAAAMERGVDLNGHRSRLVTAEEARGAGLVVVMESRHAVRVMRQFRVSPDRVLVLGDLDPESPPTRSILDPYGQSREVFAATYARIDRCVSELARVLRTAGLADPGSAPGSIP
jgi:protein-tyrosine-phosphatase